MIEGVRQSASGASDYFLSSRGDLIYRPGGSASGDNLVLNWISRDNDVEALPLESRSFDWPKVSPNGSRIAVQILAGDGPDVWLYEVAPRS